MLRVFLRCFCFPCFWMIQYFPKGFLLFGSLSTISSTVPFFSSFYMLNICRKASLEKLAWTATPFCFFVGNPAMLQISFQLRNVSFKGVYFHKSCLLTQQSPLSSVTVAALPEASSCQARGTTGNNSFNFSTKVRFHVGQHSLFKHWPGCGVYAIGASFIIQYMFYLPNK